MSRNLVGLDIGSSGVRAAEVVPGGRRAKLRRFARVPLPPGAVRAGAVADQAELTQALKTLWSQGRFRTREVVLGIGSSGVLVRQLDLDWMPPADFRKALRYQVQDVLPFSVDQANLDYHLLEELEVQNDDGTTRRVSRIMLVAASREVVDAFVDAAKGAGLRVVAVDLLPFALLRARTGEPTLDPAATEAIVDVGADVTSVVVHTGGVPRYVRMIPGAGGDSVTEAIQQRYGWTWEEAERTKVYVGLPGHAHLDPLQRSVVGEPHDGLEHAAQRVVAEAVVELADEIGTTLDFYRDSAEERPVERVLLAGAGSLLGGFPERLAARLGLPVDRLDVRDQVKASGRLRLRDLEDAAVATLAVPAGLCTGASL